MGKYNGQIKKGEHRSRETEFKQGQHWRKKKPFWERDWLENEYVNKKRSAKDIAEQFGITEAAILFWLRKHKIQSRTMKEIRKIKHWGLSGEKNGMFGKRGKDTPNWKGGITPDRQALYSSLEWKKVEKQVWERDRGKCARCGMEKKKINIHHVVSFDVVELRLDLENLITLCMVCHRWVHSKKNTEKIFIKKGGLE